MLEARRERAMIFGIGTDRRAGRARRGHVHERFGEHFVERLLLPEERALFRCDKRPVRFLAMRFAAKEAIVKALGTGFAHGVVDPRRRLHAERLGQAGGHLVRARPRARAIGSAPAKATSTPHRRGGLVIGGRRPDEEVP